MRATAGIARVTGIEQGLDLKDEDGDYYFTSSKQDFDKNSLRVRPDCDTGTEEYEVLYKEPQSAVQSPEPELITDNC